MVLDDPHHAPVVLAEGPGLVDRRHLAVLVGEHHVAERGRRLAVKLDRDVADLDLAPALQGEAGVFRELGIAADEIGQRALARRAEGVGLLGQGRLEQHRAELVAIGAVERRLGLGLRGRDAARLVVAADRDDRIAPGLLGSQHLLLADHAVLQIEGAGLAGQQGQGKRAKKDRTLRRMQGHHHLPGAGLAAETEMAPQSERRLLAA